MHTVIIYILYIFCIYIAKILNTIYYLVILINGGFYMTFLRWLGGFVVLFWLIGMLFSKGGSLINILLIVAAIVFIIDILSSKRKKL